MARLLERSHQAVYDMTYSSLDFQMALMVAWSGNMKTWWSMDIKAAHDLSRAIPVFCLRGIEGSPTGLNSSMIHGAMMSAWTWRICQV